MIRRKHLMKKNTLKFPDKFFWGASTSAHQCEGGLTNNWTQWEKVNAERLSRKAELEFSNLPAWPDIAEEAKKAVNYISGKACDHYNLFEQDFALAGQMGLNALRFSVAWERIEPEEGKFDDSEIEHYRRVIRSLKSRDIEPFLCLWHWPLPLWLAKTGGWESPRCEKLFLRYTEKIVSEFKEEVKFWVTMNEPVIFSYESYFLGVWPPQKKSWPGFLSVLNRLISTHKKAYALIKSFVPDAFVGIAKNNIDFQPKNRRLFNRLLCAAANAGWNAYFLDRINSAQDFVGLNHYFLNLVDRGFNKNTEGPFSDLGWQLHPESIYRVLLRLKKYAKPVIVLENGLADAKDVKRAWYLQEILRQIHRALEEGVDVRGYFHWSLTDNFEWDKGFWPRFGLIAVDYASQERKTRPSANVYAEIIKANAVIDPGV